jgi:anhydro-N-acetylmuramic acid kinase
MLAMGLMTGTALDGFIDAALIRTDGERIEDLGPFRLHPYGEAVRTLMAGAVAAARRWNFTGPAPAIFTEASRVFTEAHAEAVGTLLDAAGLAAGEVDVIGFHGLTALHRPLREGAPGATRQLGDGERLARAVGIDVVWDFRTADVAAGGQGAPLAPAYHAALLARGGLGAESAALNLGGVANVTWRSGAGRLIAFDTGPANGPLNEWTEALGLGPMDAGGALAASGRVDEGRLERWLAHPFFDTPYPKSLDRYDFPAKLADGLSAADGAATLTAFSAAAIGRGLDLLPERPRRLIVCGGGRKNPTLMREIALRAKVEAIDCDTLGWRGDAIEAEAMAFLAVRALKGLALSYPDTTGVARAMVGGRIARASDAAMRGKNFL